MPRPRTPLAKAKLTGAAEKHPERYKARSEPAASGRGIGKPPAYLPESARKAWATFADELPWLVHEDRAALEAASLMRGRIMDSPADATAALFAQLRQIFGKFAVLTAGRPNKVRGLSCREGGFSEFSVVAI